MNEEIYQAIKKKIVFMEYEPGQLVDEKAFTKEFKVSRTPVREVILRLEYEKLLEIIPRGGIFVKRIDFQEMRDVFLTRVLIEGEVAKLATINVTEYQLSEIEKIKAECEKMINTSNPELLIENDIALRAVMHRASKRPTLSILSDYLYYQTLRLWYLVFDITSFSVEVEHQVKEIDKTLHFLKSEDPAVGEKEGREIIRNYMHRITKYFSMPE
jgi:DNA-binding GntR family transcriptional regulator